MLSEIPDGWAVAQLSSLGTFHKGRGGSKEHETNTGVPVVRYGELYTQHHDVIRCFHSFVSPATALEYTPLHNGDVLFAGSGETLAEIGKSAAFLGPTPAYAGGDLIIFRPGAQLDSLFLGYLSNSDLVVEQKKRMGQGSSVIHIYSHNIEKVSIPLPPLPEQRKIAAILSSVDEAIRATRAVIEQTRRVKEGLLQELLTKGVGHTRFKQTPIGLIPEGWRVLKIKELGEVMAGKPRNPNGPGTLRPYLRCGNVFDDRIDVREVFEMPFTDVEFERYALRPNDILLNEGQSISLVGRPAQYKGEHSLCAFQNSLIRLRVTASVAFSGYAYQVIRKLYQSGLLANVATQTTSMAHLGVSRFANILVPIPSLMEQNSISEPLAELDNLRIKTMTQLDCMRQIKAGLLQDLLSGKKRVKP